MRSEFDPGLPLGIEPLDAGARRSRSRRRAAHSRRSASRTARRASTCAAASSAGQLGRDRARRQQPRIDLEIAEAAVAEIDQPAAVRPPARSSAAPAAYRPCARSSVVSSAMSSCGAVSRCDRPRHIQPRMRVAAHLEVPSRAVDRQIGERLPAERRRSPCRSTPSSCPCRRSSRTAAWSRRSARATMPLAGDDAAWRRYRACRRRARHRASAPAGRRRQRPAPLSAAALAMICARRSAICAAPSIRTIALRARHRRVEHQPIDGQPCSTSMSISGSSGALGSLGVALSTGLRAIVISWLAADRTSI